MNANVLSASYIIRSRPDIAGTTKGGEDACRARNETHPSMHAWMDASLLREFNKQSCTRRGFRSSALNRVGLT